MPKLSIYETIWVEREVEVPERCPECGAPFVGLDSSNLLEIDWVDLEMQGRLIGIAGGEHAFEATEHHSTGDVFHAAAVQCAACREAIVEAGNCTLAKDRAVDGSTLLAAYREARES